MRGAFYTELRQAMSVSRCLQSWRSAMRFARIGTRKLYLRLREERDRVAQESDSIRLALHHLCNAVTRYRVADNITDADLIALAEKLAKELNRDESGNDC